MSAMKIKKGDTVKVIAGKEKDKEGKVIAVNKKDNTVIIENVNMVSKHTKPSAANQNGGIISREAPINVSNVMLLFQNKPVRVGFKIEDGKKYRVAKVGNGETKVIDVISSKKTRK